MAGKTGGKHRRSTGVNCNAGEEEEQQTQSNKQNTLHDNQVTGKMTPPGANFYRVFYVQVFYMCFPHLAALQMFGHHSHSSSS